MQGDRDTTKVPPVEMKFVDIVECEEQDDLYQQLRKVIDLNKSNHMDIYGLRFLLPRIAKDFFSRGGGIRIMIMMYYWHVRTIYL